MAQTARPCSFAISFTTQLRYFSAMQTLRASFDAAKAASVVGYRRCLRLKPLPPRVTGFPHLHFRLAATHGGTDGLCFHALRRGDEVPPKWFW